MSKQLDDVNARLDALEPRVATLETEVTNFDDPAAVEAVVTREQGLEDRVTKLESFFPASADGSGSANPDVTVSDSSATDTAPTEQAPSQSVL